jgi:uncharacterized membrane-anchored protein
MDGLSLPGQTDGNPFHSAGKHHEQFAHGQSKRLAQQSPGSHAVVLDHQDHVHDGGRDGADFLAVNAGFGQGLTRTVMGALLAIALFMQLRTRRYTPWIYWLTVVLVSVVGTQITDLLTDGLGVSLYISTSAFAVTLAAIFFVWYRVERTLSIHDIVTRRRELFYWSAILCTFALGTAAGDLATEALGWALPGAVAFGALIGITYAAWRMGGNAVLTFWIGYILTRPFGAALGDLLTQAKTYGGLGMGPCGPAPCSSQSSSCWWPLRRSA